VDARHKAGHDGKEEMMDLRFTPEEQAFRQEVRTFFRENLPEKTRLKMEEGRSPSKDEIVAWQRILNKKGWAVAPWPKEYGGTGWTPMQQYIFLEEMQATPAPQPLQFGVNMVGPVIYTFANDEQKRRFLPRIANLDDWWCQGFSEPGSGSDLASLKTSAKRDGDHYVVNGQKTWTTLAQYADWIFCLVRTDPAAKKQEGVSFLLIDMKTPGITVRPIQTIDGGREVNEVFFDDVRVPLENLVGQENKGWDYAKFLLGNERVGIARIGVSKQRLRRIRELAAQEFEGDRAFMDNPRFREKLAAIEIDLKALEMTTLRVVSAEGKRERGKPDPASSILKIKGTEIQQATTELLMEVVGPYALPYEPHREEGWNEPPVGPDYAAPLAPLYFNWRKTSIYGGSNEIQKNIIAKAILGL
jgi:pimeloyl-CoA dehydrogenase large subunit